MLFIIYSTLFLSCVLATPIPLKTFLYDVPSEPSYTIDNEISKAISISYTIDNEISKAISIKENIENSEKINEDILWKDMNESLEKYYNLLREINFQEYNKINWDKMNKEIMDELCEEMKGEIDEFLCVRHTKTYELQILSENNEAIDINNLIKKAKQNESPYIIFK